MNKSEAQIQQDIIIWFRNTYCLKHHNPRYCIFSVPNEATYKNKNFKLTGVLNGVSDLIVLLDGKTLFIELKDHKGKQSKNQIDFQNQVSNLSFDYHIIRSLESFKVLINDYLTKFS